MASSRTNRTGGTKRPRLLATAALIPQKPRSKPHGGRSRKRSKSKRGGLSGQLVPWALAATVLASRKSKKSKKSKKTKRNMRKRRRNLMLN